MHYSLHDVFISYRRFEDKEKTNGQGTRLAEAIYRFLTKKGLRVFWDDPEMEPGDFEEQLHWQIEHSPNYIFIGTEAAKRFRPDVKDFVAEEVRLALELYNASPNKDRVAIHVLPMMSDMDRKRTAEAGPYPDEIQKLTKLHGVELHGELPTDKDLSEILKHVTRVNNRGNVWNAGHRWFEQSRKAGHRFEALNINKSIMPNANIQRQEDVRLPIRAHGDGQADLPLLEMIEKTPGHLYLIGEGGIGKTTALYSIMEDVYGGDLPTGSMEQLRLHGQVPLFVELSRAPDTYGKLYEGGKSTFIHRAVYQQLRQDLSAKQVPGSAVRQLDEVFEIDPETAVNPIHDLFTQQSPAPEYLLLLDGLNEVSRVVIEHREEPEMKSAVVTMILQEIHQLMTKCPNVRVILTSRSKEQTSWGDETTLLYLSGVNDDSVKDYLAKANVSQARIESAMNNEKLRDVLRVPLFLTLYAALDGDEELLTQGEILHLFFHQKKKALYSTRTRIDQVDEDVDKAASAKQFHRLTTTMQGFILDFILPEIAWQMEQNDMFQIYKDGDEDEPNLTAIIEHVLTDESVTAVCGMYGDAFDEYLSDSDVGQDTLSIAKDMIERLGGRMRRVIDSVLNCAIMTLGIMRKNGDEFEFIHHHIRDYFAAVYQINRLKLAVYLQKRKRNELARQCLQDWKNAPLHVEVCRFIGEALGEAHNAPVCDDKGNWHYVVPEKPCERNLIKRGLDIYRGRLDGKDGYAVWNLLEVLKVARMDLSGENFSALNLTKCEVNGYAFGKKSLAAVLTNARLSDSLFIPRGHSETITFAVYCPDRSKIVTASVDNTAKVWDAETMQVIGTLHGHTDRINSVAYSLDGCRIVTASSDNTAKVWDAETLQEKGTLCGHKDRVTFAAYSPDGCKIVTTSWDNTAMLWDAESLQAIGALQGNMGGVYSAAFNPDGHKIATASWIFGVITVWDAETLQQIKTINTHQGTIKALVYSPDGHKLVTASEYNTAKVWDAETLQEIGTLSGHKDRVTSVAYSPDGCRIVTTSWDKTAVIWDARTLQRIGTLQGHRNWVNSASYSSDGCRIVTTSNDRTAKVWDANMLQNIGTLQGHAYGVYSAIYSLDGCRIMTIPMGDGLSSVWDAKTLRYIEKVRGTGKEWLNRILLDTKTQQKQGKWVPYWFPTIAISPDKCRIVTIKSNNAVKIMDAETLKEIGILKGHTDRINSVTYSPDGCTIVTASNDNTARIWNVETMQEVGTLMGHNGSVNYAAYSPDGRRIVTGSSDGTVKVWDTETLLDVGTLKENALFIINSVSYSSDGRRIVSASDNNHAMVWNAETLRMIGVLYGHVGSVFSAAYSPDSCRIVTASIDGTIKIWHAETFECLHTIHNIPGLEIIGVDLRHLHPDSHLSDEVKELLYEYGAIVDKRG